MLLAVDIGNTNVVMGVFKNKELLVTWRIATDIHTMPDEYASTLMNLLHYRKMALSDIKDMAICSVVPPVTSMFEELSEKYLNSKAVVVEAGIKTGVRIRMDNPKEVGADRIVNAAAAHALYKGQPLIIADFGTATTFDTVSRDGDYIGGAIAPGILTAADALFTRTAKLYRVEIVRPRKAIGTNSITAMQSGIIFGYVGLVEGIVSRIQKELDEKAMVIATGGLGGMIAKETKVIDKVDPDLTLVGLRLIYEMNKA
jgi:type III pantothenate kinase